MTCADVVVLAMRRSSRIMTLLLVPPQLLHQQPDLFDRYDTDLLVIGDERLLQVEHRLAQLLQEEGHLRTWRFARIRPLPQSGQRSFVHVPRAVAPICSSSHGDAPSFPQFT